jgi:hypothetical protein
MPMGAHGMMELSAGFGDEAWARGGVWFNRDSIAFFKSVLEAGMSRIDLELARAAFSGSQVLKCISNHRAKAAWLGLHKFVHAYRPHSSPEFTLTTLACGLWFGHRKQMVWIPGSLYLINTSMIAVTWLVDPPVTEPSDYHSTTLICYTLAAKKRELRAPFGDAGAAGVTHS